MKVLVTGAAGFIGSHLTRRLAADGHDVVAIDNFSLADQSLQQARREWVEELVPILDISILDFPALEELFAAEGFDLVFHLAAKPGVRESITNPFIYAQSNYEGTLNVFEAAQRHGVPHVVAASSSSVYGRTATAPFREDATADEPVSVYAATKRAGELLAYTYCDLYDMNITCLRFFTVYGPFGRPDMAPWIFTERILNNEPITVYDHGNHMRDFTYVDDIVEGCVGVAGAPQGHNIVNLGNSRPVELMDFIETIEQLSGKTATKEFVPGQPGEVNHTHADVGKAKALFGYAPSYSIEDGLQRFIDWFREYRQAS